MDTIFGPAQLHKPDVVLDSDSDAIVEGYQSLLERGSRKYMATCVATIYFLESRFQLVGKFSRRYIEEFKVSEIKEFTNRRVFWQQRCHKSHAMEYEASLMFRCCTKPLNSTERQDNKYANFRPAVRSAHESTKLSNILMNHSPS
ncbi:hypothetical protein EVAR_8287_1 [Eumeta japonica]|uniref:Uncharacterized protein n=1 Tax=Eumeta variegata TaxID=151549 RepID=A0A4C1Y631_EUMVA|nr:hypothetical protein EVAR_8287_1 [Eumeta japonica]